MKKQLAVIGAVSAFACSLAVNAAAVPLTLASPGVVGIVDGVSGSTSPGTELPWAQHILDMAASTTDTTFTAGRTYQTSATEYSGTLTGGVKTDGGSFVVPSGYEYVFAKYDGQNAGYVLFHIPTWGSTTIPQYSYSIWGGNPSQYAISHFTAFNPDPFISVPDGGSVTMLLGMAMLGLAGIRRMMA